MGLWMFLAVTGLVAVAALPSGEKYSDMYDHMDVDEVLKNERLYGRYKDCLMDKGVCPPPAKVLKGNLKEALSTNCAKCTDSQKSFMKKSMMYLQENKPEDIKLIVQYYGSATDDVDGLMERIKAF